MKQIKMWKMLAAIVYIVFNIISWLYIVSILSAEHSNVKTCVVDILPFFDQLKFLWIIFHLFIHTFLVFNWTQPQQEICICMFEFAQLELQQRQAQVNPSVIQVE